MSARLASVALSVLFLAASVPVGVLGGQRVQTRAARPSAGDDSLDRFVREIMRARRIPGLQYAVVRHGAIVRTGAFGFANVQDSVRVTPRTLFTINSATKAFTGVAVMQLVEEGRLQLDAPVSRYLNGLPESWRSRTIRQLLTHTSGLPDIMDSDAVLVAPGFDSAWVRVQKLPVQFAAGERFSYNQTNYLLVGMVIDRLAGIPFVELITRRQFQPAGMRRTMQHGFGDSHDVVPHSARGYTFFRSPGRGSLPSDLLTNVFEEFPPPLRTAAGISSTATELAQWVAALQAGTLLHARTSLATLWTPAPVPGGAHRDTTSLLNGYALGWFTAERPAHRAVAAIGGGRSAIFVYPDDDLAVVVLTNLQGAVPQEFVDAIAAHFIPSLGAVARKGLQ